MTIVIKSQSGDIIFNPNKIILEPYGTNAEGYNVSNILPNNARDYIGKYPTKKRAEEVINEIFDGIEFAGSCKEYVGCPVFTYKMPKE